VLERVVRKTWGIFFYRESCKRRAYRESLSEAYGLLERVGDEGLGSFFYRESCKRWVWSAFKKLKMHFQRAKLAVVQAYKNRVANVFATQFLYAWTVPRSAEKMHLTPLTPLTSSLCKLSPVALPVKKKQPRLVSYKTVVSYNVCQTN